MEDKKSHTSVKIIIDFTLGDKPVHQIFKRIKKYWNQLSDQSDRETVLYLEYHMKNISSLSVVSLQKIFILLNRLKKNIKGMTICVFGKIMYDISSIFIWT